MQISPEIRSLPVYTDTPMQSAPVTNLTETQKAALEELKSKLPTTSQQNGITQQALNDAIELLQKSSNPTETMKRILTSDLFAELHIASSPQTQEAFSDLLDAMNLSKDEILDALKFQDKSDTLYSGEFFKELSEKLKSVSNASVKTTVIQLLRSYDCTINFDGSEDALKALVQKLMKYVTDSLYKSLLDYLDILLVQKADTKTLSKQVESVLLHITERVTKVIQENPEMPIEDALKQVLKELIPQDALSATIYHTLELQEPTTFSTADLQSFLLSFKKDLNSSQQAQLEEITQQLMNADTPEESLKIQKELFKFIQDSSLPADSKNSAFQSLEDFSKGMLSKLLLGKDSSTKSDSIYDTLAQKLLQFKDSFNTELHKTMLLPQLLQNRKSLPEETISLIQQKIVRMNDGLPSSLEKALNQLFSNMETNQVSKESTLALRYQFLETFLQKTNQSNRLNDAVANFLQAGIKNQPDSAGKATFEELLWSLVLKYNVNLPVQYSFLPIHYGNVYFLSELWKTKKKEVMQREDDEDEKQELKVKEVHQLFLTFEIQGIGYFESSIYYDTSNVLLELSIPSSLQSHSQQIASDIRTIVERNCINMESMILRESDTPTPAEQIVQKLLK